MSIPFFKKDQVMMETEDIKRSAGRIRDCFILIRSLGSGSFGNVLLVKDKASGLERAAKEMIKTQLSQEMTEAFCQELAVLRNLDHPSVIRLYEILETPSRLYIITEYLSGGQLFERISKSPRISEKTIAKYFFDIILGLNFYHTHGINHGDIKPENLLFESESPDSHIKLIDFGIIGLKTKVKDNTVSAGPVTYSAPEKLSGRYSDKSDIWSAGVMLFTMLSGRIPFQGKTEAESIRKIIEKPVPMTGKVWENISPEAKNLIQKMLSKSPEDRPTAEEILMDPWLFSYTKNTISSNPLHPEAASSLVRFYVIFI